MLINKPIHLIGAGGHGTVVLDSLLSIAPSDAVQVCDDNPALAGQDCLGQSIRAPYQLNALLDGMVHVAIGNNAVRKKICLLLIDHHADLLTVIHPSSVIAESASLAPGTFVAAQANVAAETAIGAAVIVNHQANVDHHTTIGNYCHIGPGATMGGNVSIGENCLLGINCTVLPGIKIGNRVTIGAGAIVTRNVPDDQTIIGVW